MPSPCPQGSRAGYGVFRQHIGQPLPALPPLRHPCRRLCWRQTGRHPCRPPCGLFLHPPAAAEGTPGRAARILRALFRRTRSRARARAKPQQSHSKAVLCCGCCFPLHHRVRARMARSSTRGPCAAVSRGRQAAQRASPWMDSPFRTGRMPVRKARPRLTNLPGMARAWMPEWRQRRSSCPMPGKRQAGCRFLWVTSLLDKPVLSG